LFIMRELTKALAAQRGLSEADAKGFLQAALDGIIEELVREGRIKLGDFGTFEVKQRKARLGRNPRTGERIQIPASLYARFRPGRRLKDRVGQLSEVPKKGSEVPKEGDVG
jgi:nucleoid DNA-binding protein